jgi:hypothetical protein
MCDAAADGVMCIARVVCRTGCALTDCTRLKFALRTAGSAVCTACCTVVRAQVFQNSTRMGATKVRSSWKPLLVWEVVVLESTRKMQAPSAGGSKHWFAIGLSRHVPGFARCCNHYTGDTTHQLRQKLHWPFQGSLQDCSSYPALPGR